MLKSELEKLCAELQAELDKLHKKQDAFKLDLQDAREAMALDASRLQGSVQQCDLILASLEEE